VLTGAVLLADAVPFLPPDAVALAIVDPGSGTDRKAVAVETSSGMVLVGPDNGVLSMAWTRAGGPVRAVEVTSADVILSPVSKVFQGRDVFAPAAAHVAAGGRLDELGAPLEVETLVRATLNEPDVEHHLVKAEVFDVDRFGNVRLNARASHLEAADMKGADRIELVTPAGSHPARLVETYREIPEGELGLLEDPWGWLGVSRFAVEAASVLDVRAGDPLWLKPQG
jgi:hypothetical protein